MTTPPPDADPQPSPDLSIRGGVFSFIWNRSFSNAFYPENLSERLAPFRSKEDLIPLVTAITQGKTTEYTLPWKPGSDHRFWSYYLNNAAGNIHDLAPDVIWTNHIPLRRSMFISLEPLKVPGNLTRLTGWAESFHYSHGITIVLSIRVQGKWSASEFSQLARIVRRDRWLRPERTALPVSIETWARGTFEQQLAQAGVNETLFRTPDTAPRTVFTALNATGEEIENDAVLAPLLDVLTSWTEFPSDDTSHFIKDPDEFEQLKIFQQKRGHAIWHGYWVKYRGQRATLDCLHRNQTMLALQIESLANFVCSSRVTHQERSMLGLVHESSARSAVALLDDLRSRSTRTYKSRAAERMLNSHHEDFPSALTNLRDILGS